jgi:hypothetical protein
MKQPPFQVGVIVESVEDAMDELSRVLGATWGQVGSVTLQGFPIRVVFSVEGPPFIELIEGPAGSPWDSTLGSRLDHIGFWVNDLDAAVEAAQREGLEISADGRPEGVGYVYLASKASGMRIEYLSADLAPMLYGGIGREDQLPPKTSD